MSGEISCSEDYSRANLSVAAANWRPRRWPHAEYPAVVERRRILRLEIRRPIRNRGSSAARPRLLHRRALAGAVRTVHATIAGFRAEHCLAMLAFIEPRAGVGGHRLVFALPARRTGDGGIRYNGIHRCTCFTLCRTDSRHRPWRSSALRPMPPSGQLSAVWLRHRAFFPWRRPCQH
jgi:hypothetical protein